MVAAAATGAAWGWVRTRRMPYVGGECSGGCDRRRLQGGQRARGRRDRQIVRMRPERAELEAHGQVRTFVGGPSAAQWAMAGGGAPPNSMTALGRAHRVGNGRERLPPPSACDRHTCWRRPYELEGDLGDESCTT